MLIDIFTGIIVGLLLAYVLGLWLGGVLFLIAPFAAIAKLFHKKR